MLSDQQIACARMLASDPERPKTEIARSLRISARTVWRWLEQEEFAAKVEELRDNPLPTNDVKVLIERLSETQKAELSRLLAGKARQLPAVGRIVEEIEYLPLQEREGAVEAAERALRGLRRQILGDRRYKADGSLVDQPLRESADEILESLWIGADVEGDTELAVIIEDARERLQNTVMAGPQHCPRNTFTTKSDEDEDVYGDDELENEDIRDEEPV